MKKSLLAVLMCAILASGAMAQPLLPKPLEPGKPQHEDHTKKSCKLEPRLLEGTEPRECPRGFTYNENVKLCVQTCTGAVVPSPAGNASCLTCPVDYELQQEGDDYQCVPTNCDNLDPQKCVRQCIDAYRLEQYDGTKMRCVQYSRECIWLPDGPAPWVPSPNSRNDIWDDKLSGNVTDDTLNPGRPGKAKDKRGRGPLFRSNEAPPCLSPNGTLCVSVVKSYPATVISREPIPPTRRPLSTRNPDCTADKTWRQFSCFAPCPNFYNALGYTEDNKRICVPECPARYFQCVLDHEFFCVFAKDPKCDPAMKTNEMCPTPPEP